MSKRIICLLLCALVFLLAGCGAPPPAPAGHLSASEAEDYGNGVWGLPFSNVPNRLSAFKHEHPDLVVTVVTGASEFGYGQTMSLVVITEPRCPCNTTVLPD